MSEHKVSFFSLPPELRKMVYTLAFSTHPHARVDRNTWDLTRRNTTYQPFKKSGSSQFLRTCKTVATEAEHLLYLQTHFHIESAKDLIYLKRMMDEITAKAVIKTLHMDKTLINKTRMKELSALSNLSTVSVTWVAGTTTRNNYQVLKWVPHDPATDSVLHYLIQHQETLPYRVMLEIGYTDCAGNAKNGHVKMTSSVNFRIEQMVGFGCRHREYTYRGVEEGKGIMLQVKLLRAKGKQGKIALSQM